MLKTNILMTIVLGILLFGGGSARAQTKAPSSQLASVSLPAGAARLDGENVPAEIRETLEKLVAPGDAGRRGGEEVLIWTGGGYRRANAPLLISRFAVNLQSAGWTYAAREESEDFTVFDSINTALRRRAVGFFAVTDDALLLAWTEILPASTRNVNQTPVAARQSRSMIDDRAENVIRVGADVDFVNVMGDRMPAAPEFPALQKKRGYARGYVKDWTGKPLAGAYIGVRGVGIVGSTGGANSTTDAAGFYEVKIPWGSADFYAAGYAIAYGAGRAALSLHPADGALSGFASVEGAVENFVLLPYGVASRAAQSGSPQLSSTYYGGSISLSYGTRAANDCCVPPSYLVENSEIEITLTAEGELLDETAPRRFVIRKNVGNGYGLKIHNIPVGRYRIAVKQANGKPLKFTQIVPTEGSPFAMQPRAGTSGASLYFYPDSAQTSLALAGTGRWNSVEIALEMP